MFSSYDHLRKKIHFAVDSRPKAWLMIDRLAQQLDFLYIARLFRVLAARAEIKDPHEN
jgi:hypothetical protein